MKWIVFLRGVNVGGHGRLPMKELREKLSATTFCQEVSTYIQSGNLLLESDLTNKSHLGRELSGFLDDEFRFTPSVLVLSPEQLKVIASQNPYPDAEENPKALHFYFLSSHSKQPDVGLLEKKRLPSESFELSDDVLYLHAPEGIGRSKLAASVEKALGVACTARNWKTVAKMLSLAFPV